MTSWVPRLPEHAGRTIEQFLRAHVEQAGAKGVVVGLSGGIDSALTAHLARDALGPTHVRAVLLPDAHFPAALMQETEGFARSLGVGTTVMEFEGIEREFQRTLGDPVDPVALGNIKARIRMTLLYGVARREGALVVGTGNKSEILLGYFTKYGDGGVDLAPIGDLYKTQVQTLAAEMQLPEAIRSRPPTAGFWEGQTDEAELGAPYAQLDLVLAGLEQLRSEEEIVRGSHLDAALVRAITARVQANRHKRRLPPIPKLGLRTVGLDWKD